MDRIRTVRLRARRHAAALGAALALVAAHGAQASTVRSVSMAEMVARAELVFDGRVLDVWVEQPAGPQSIRTCARFEVLEVLKGAAVAAPLELCFAGGAVPGLRRTVAGVTLPEVGERGFYFVEDLDEPLVHPLTGWAQGHFRVAPGPVEVVMSEDGQPVVAVEPDDPRVGALSRGVARGAHVAPPGSRAPAMDAATFAARVRALAEGE